MWLLCNSSFYYSKRERERVQSHESVTYKCQRGHITSLNKYNSSHPIIEVYGLGTLGFLIEIFRRTLCLRTLCKVFVISDEEKKMDSFRYFAKTVEDIYKTELSIFSLLFSQIEKVKSPRLVKS